MTSQAIPRVHYDELQKGLSDGQITEIKEAGVVIVRGAVSKEVRCRSCIPSGICIDAATRRPLAGNSP